MDQNPGNLEVALLLDTTGSMNPYIRDARQRAAALARMIMEHAPGTRLGAVGYGDHCDGHRMMTTLALTADLAKAARFITRLRPTNGGDTPEAIECVIQAVRGWKWSSPRRKAILICDAPGHGWSAKVKDQGCPLGVDLRGQIRAAGREGLAILTVQCGSCAETRRFLQWTAQETGGRYLTLTQMEDTADLIAAICAWEAGNLQAFTQALEAEGRMTPSKREILVELGGGCF